MFCTHASFTYFYIQHIRSSYFKRVVAGDGGHNAVTLYRSATFPNACKQANTTYTGAGVVHGSQPAKRHAMLKLGSQT